MLDQYKDRKICIAFPSPESTNFRFNIALMETMMQNANMIPIRMAHTTGTGSWAQSRNVLVDQAKKVGITDIIWIDTDSIFQINAILRLLRHDKDIVGVTNAGRRGDLSMPNVDESTIVNGLVPMSVLGFPMMLTKMKIFDAMQRPYFAEPPRHLVPEIDVRKDELVNEDEFFCHYARKAGFEVYCDMALSMEIGHIRTEVAYLKTEMTTKADVDIDLAAPVQRAEEPPAA